MPKFNEKVLKLLKEPNVAVISTLGVDGYPHSVPAWVGLEGDRLTVNSAEGRKWPENLRRETKISLTIPNRENPYEYVFIKAELEADTHEGADEHINQLTKKYLDKDEYPFRQADEQRIKFTLRPVSVNYYG